MQRETWRHDPVALFALQEPVGHPALAAPDAVKALIGWERIEALVRRCEAAVGRNPWNGACFRRLCG